LSALVTFAKGIHLRGYAQKSWEYKREAFRTLWSIAGQRENKVARF
jgi:hypothetical protein